MIKKLFVFLNSGLMEWKEVIEFFFSRGLVNFFDGCEIWKKDLFDI